MDGNDHLSEIHLANTRIVPFWSFLLDLGHSGIVLFSAVAECNICTINHLFCRPSSEGKKKSCVGFSISQTIDSLYQLTTVLTLNILFSRFFLPFSSHLFPFFVIFLVSGWNSCLTHVHLFFFSVKHQEKFSFPSLGNIFFQIPYYGPSVFSLPTHLLVQIITTISILFILILTILSRLFYDIMMIVPVCLFLFVYETYFFSLISTF